MPPITIFVFAQRGFGSQSFAFYFPALLGLSVAFPTMIAFLYTGGAIGFYALVSLVSLMAEAVRYAHAHQYIKGAVNRWRNNFNKRHLAITVGINI